MFRIDLKNRRPIYEQVIDNFKRVIIEGGFKEGDRVPSVRDMARELGVNPNTVQKAYRELEVQRYFYTVQGQGSFINAPPEDKAEVKKLYERLAHDVRGLIFYGESKGEIALFVQDLPVGITTEGENVK